MAVVWCGGHYISVDVLLPVCHLSLSISSRQVTLDVFREYIINCIKDVLRHLHSSDETGHWLRFYVPLDTKQVILETFPKPISWPGMEKTKPNTKKHTFTNQKKHTILTKSEL